VPVPPQNRVGHPNHGYLAQRGAPDTVSTRRQPAPVIIREPNPSATQLDLQDVILSTR
jgi:hypothetical protein